MSNPTIAPEQRAALRRRAASRLNRASNGRYFSATDALATLFAMASSPNTASDALALLHELQVHQVELELQAEDVRESRAESEAELRRRMELYDAQPVGCFTVDAAFGIVELNLRGADMLGVGKDAACGLVLDSFLTLDSGRAIREQVAKALRGTPCLEPLLQLLAQDEAGRNVRAYVSVNPGAPGFLVVFCNVTG